MNEVGFVAQWVCFFPAGVNLSRSQGGLTINNLLTSILNDIYRNKGSVNKNITVYQKLVLLRQRETCCDVVTPTI